MMNKRDVKQRKFILVSWLTSLSICLGVMVLFLMPVSAKIKIPQPRQQFYVNDYANVLTQETKDYIVTQNDAMFASNEAQIVVVTIDFLDGYEIEDYAYAMFNEWNIGGAKQKNGVLVLLVIGEENYWVLQGQGLENTMSSGTIKTILQENMEPPFSIGDYNTGVIKTFQALQGVIEGIYGPVDPDAGNEQQGYGTPIGSALVMLGGFFIQMFFIIFLIIVVTAIFRGRRYRRGFGPLFFPRPRYYRHTPHRPHRPGPGMGSFGGGLRPGGRSGGFGGGSRGGGPRMGGGGSSRGGGAGRF